MRPRFVTDVSTSTGVVVAGTNVVTTTNNMMMTMVVVVMMMMMMIGASTVAQEDYSSWWFIQRERFEKCRYLSKITDNCKILPMNEEELVQTLQEAKIGSFFRPKDVEPLGISHYDLQKLVAAGEVERVSRGVYWLTSAEITEHHTLAEVAANVPAGIVCLLSALVYHGIGTQLPRRVWLAIDVKARQPRVPDLPVRFVRFSGASLIYGVQRVHFEGVPSRVTSPARTVADCFRHRNLVGHDVALEALTDTLREGKATRDEIWRAAEVRGALSTVGPALEALST